MSWHSIFRSLEDSIDGGGLLILLYTGRPRLPTSSQVHGASSSSFKMAVLFFSAQSEYLSPDRPASRRYLGRDIYMAKDTRNDLCRDRFYGLMPSAASLFAESVVFRGNVGEYPRKDFIVTKIVGKDSNVNTLTFIKLRRFFFSRDFYNNL